MTALLAHCQAVRQAAFAHAMALGGLADSCSAPLATDALAASAEDLVEQLDALAAEIAALERPRAA